MSGILDVRVYALKPGTRAAFDERFHARVLPMLRRHRIRVVSAGPSLHDAVGYHLLRAFESLEQRQAQLDGFYGSDEWKSEHDDAVMAMIESYNVCVIPAGALVREAAALNAAR